MLLGLPRETLLVPSNCSFRLSLKRRLNTLALEVRQFVRLAPPSRCKFCYKPGLRFASMKSLRNFNRNPLFIKILHNFGLEPTTQLLDEETVVRTPSTGRPDKGLHQCKPLRQSTLARAEKTEDTAICIGCASILRIVRRQKISHNCCLAQCINLESQHPFAERTEFGCPLDVAYQIHKRGDETRDTQKIDRIDTRRPAPSGCDIPHPDSSSLYQAQDKSTWRIR